MRNYYYEPADHFFSESVAEKVCQRFNITLSDCIEYVRCADGVLRDVRTVAIDDRACSNKTEIDYYND
jgi:hypothetical protein